MAEISSVTPAVNASTLSISILSSSVSTASHDPRLCNTDNADVILDATIENTTSKISPIKMPVSQKTPVSGPDVPALVIDTAAIHLDEVASTFTPAMSKNGYLS